MSISAHSGRPGTGKTYNAVREILKLLNSGEKVWSNIWIDWEGYVEKRTWWKKGLIMIGLKREWNEYPKENLKYWKSLNDITEVENGYIFMDEAHVYMNARRWKGMSEEMERKLAQHRKDGLHMIVTVQSVNRLDVVFRELIDFWYVYENNLLWFTRWEFSIDDDKAKRFPLSKRWFWKKRRIYESYDTLEKVWITDEEKNKTA